MIWGLRGAFALILAMIGAKVADVWWKQSLPSETPQRWWGVTLSSTNLVSHCAEPLGVRPERV